VIKNKTMIRLYYFRKYYVFFLLLLLIVIFGWAIDLSMINSVKVNFLDLPKPSEWLVVQKAKFWDFESNWLLLTTTQKNYEEWLTYIGKPSSLEIDELQDLPKQAIRLANEDKFKWEKYNTLEHGIIYFASPREIGKKFSNSNNKIKMVVVTTNL
jgi:hypothetical protein